MTLPDKDHPAWKLAQSVVTVIGLAIVVWHLREHGDNLSIGEGASGAVGVGLGGKLAVQFLRGLFTEDS